MLTTFNLKKTIRKVPIVSGAAKLVYDWRQEKKLEDRVKKLVISNELPFKNFPPPFYSVGYEPTIRCNLRCKMCYQGQTRALRESELSTKETMRVFEKLKNKTKEIKLVGGEPFVRKDILEMINFWYKNNTRTILQTNCTLIGENNIKTISQLKNITDILTSLDGPKDVHDAIRGVPGAFEKLKKAIKLLQDNRPDIGITVFATMLPWDNLDKLCELIDTCKDLGISTLNLIFEQVYLKEEVEAAKKIFENVLGWPACNALPSNAGRSVGNYRLNTQIRDKLFPDDLSAKKFKKILSKARFYGLRKNCFVNFVPFNYYRHPEKYLLGIPGRPACNALPARQPNLPEMHSLRAGGSLGGGRSNAGRPFCLKLLSSELRINQTGDVIWCDVIEKSFGNLLEKTPDEIWPSDGYQKFREYLFKNSLPICRRCCKAFYV